MTGTKRSFDDWLWSLDDQSLNSLRLEALQRAAIGDLVDFPQITVATVISDVSDPVERLARVGIGAADYRATSWGGLVQARMNRSSYVVAVWRSSEECVFHLLSSPPWTDSRWRRVEQSWINAAAPTMARVLLNNDEFKAMGDLLSEFGNIAVSRLAARVLADNSSYTRGWPGDDFGDHPNHIIALSEVKDGMAIHTLSFAVGNKLSIHLRRLAGATFYKGDFALFTKVVLGRLAGAASERRMVLTGHERRIDEPISEAIVMTFDAAVAGDLRDRLLESLADARGVRAAVLHGNPYLHLIVTDYLNGSNFDVLVTERDRLRLLPGFKATASSMARITDAVGEALGMRGMEVESIPTKLSEAELFSD